MQTLWLWCIPGTWELVLYWYFFFVNEYLDISRSDTAIPREWEVGRLTFIGPSAHASTCLVSTCQAPSQVAHPTPHSPHPPSPQVPLLHTHIKLLSMLLQDPLHTLMCTVSAYQILQPALPHNGAAEQILLELHHCHTLTCTASVQLPWC